MIHKILSAWDDALSLFGRKEVIYPVTVGQETRLCMAYEPSPREMVEIAAIMQTLLVKLGLNEISTRFYANDDVLPFIRAYGIETTSEVVPIPHSGVNCPKLVIAVECKNHRLHHLVAAINGTLSFRSGAIDAIIGDHYRVDVAVIAVDDVCEVAMCAIATRLRFHNGNGYTVISVVLPGATSAECIEYARDISAKCVYVVTPEHWAANQVECIEL